jgi:hypothetical protein
MNSNYDNIKDSKEKNEEDDEINLEKETIKRVKIYIILNGWSHNYIENDSQNYFYLKNLDEEYLDKKFIKSMGKIKNHYYEILRRFGLFYYDRKIIKFIYKYLVIDKKITFEEICELKNLMKEEFKNLNELYENVHNDKVRLFKDPFEEKKNYMNDIICKQKYDKPNLQLCKCTTNSAKTVKTLNKPPTEYFY